MRLLVLAAALCVNVTALAQTGQKPATDTSPTKGAVERPAEAFPTDEDAAKLKAAPAAAPVVSAATFVAPEAEMLRKLELETATLTKQLTNTQLRASIKEAGKDKSEGPGQPQGRGFPELLGTSSARGKTHAEFLVGDGVIEFGVGDWVTPEFRVAKIGPTGVELKDRNGRSSQMAVGVTRPTAGGMAGPSLQTTMPMSVGAGPPPMYPASTEMSVTPSGQ